MLNLVNLGKAIKLVRENRGYTQKDLSQKLNKAKSNSYMSYIESGKRFTNIETINNISIALNIKPYELVYLACAMEDTELLKNTKYLFEVIK